jgi:hypothetical protein
MSTLGLALLTLPLLIAAPEEGPLVETTPAVVRVISGRATLVRGARIETLSRRSRPRRVEGAVYVECGPAAKVAVSWRGLSSLRMSGSTALEWEIDPAAPDHPRVRVVRPGILELEVRRGGVTVELPGAWRLEMAACALQVRERPGGGLELLHHGGEAVSIESLVERPKGQGTRELLSGGRLLLSPPPPVPPPDQP